MSKARLAVLMGALGTMGEKIVLGILRLQYSGAVSDIAALSDLSMAISIDEGINKSWPSAIAGGEDSFGPWVDWSAVPRVLSSTKDRGGVFA